MVFIEVVEVDVFEYEQQKLKKNLKLIFFVILEVVFYKFGSLLVEEKDISVLVSFEGMNMLDKGGEFSDFFDELLINVVIVIFFGLFL